MADNLKVLYICILSVPKSGEQNISRKNKLFQLIIKKEPYSSLYPISTPSFRHSCQETILSEELGCIRLEAATQTPS